MGRWTWNTAGGSLIYKAPSEAQLEAPKEEGFAGLVQDIERTPVLNDIISRFLKVSDRGIIDDIRSGAIDPIKNKKAEASVIKARLIDRIVEKGKLEDLSDSERIVYKKERDDIIKEVRRRLRTQGSEAETRAILKARSRQEKQAAASY
jgi:hypothetical protein